MATVLVVDDEHGVAELFNAIFTDEGHRVLTAVNGKHGLEVLAQEHADLVFLDFMMPVMSGAVMLDLMMADPIWHDIPVVIMSVMPETIIAKRCSGYAGVLCKPFRITQVLDVAEQLLTKVGDHVS